MLQLRLKNDLQDEIIDLDTDAHAGRVEFDKQNSRFILIQDPYVSRSQFTLSVDHDEITIRNIGSSEIVIESGEAIAPEEEQILTKSDTFVIGQTQFRFLSKIQLPDESAGGNLHTINSPVFLEGTLRGAHGINDGKANIADKESRLLECLEAVLTVQKSSAGSQSFYQETADAIVHTIGLDYGMVLLKGENSLETVAICDNTSHQNVRPSTTVMDRVLAEKRTFYELDDDTRLAASMASISAVVASPIFDMAGEIIGIVYGAKEGGHGGVSELEAQITQLLACSVSSGLARIERDAEMSRLRIQFEEFVSPELARELERDPMLLDGREKNITCLFADLRGFSSISEVLGAQGIYDLMQDVMDTLTASVIEQNGVIINYAGDGLAAMWNAPVDQQNHAELACSAAIAMQNGLPILSEKWFGRTGIPLKVGIGINTGSALVGNAGSSLHIKYGPMGNSVNLASRVEGTTKFFNVPVLITKNTQALIGDRFQTRRIGSVRVVGIQEPTTLFELRHTEASPDWLENSALYESALRAFQEKDFEACTSIIDDMTKSDEFNADRPSSLLSTRAREAMTNQTEPFDPVLNLDQK